MIEKLQNGVAWVWDWTIARLREPSTRIAMISAATTAAVVPAPWCHVVFFFSALSAIWPDKAQ